MTHLTGNEKGYMALKNLAAGHVRDNLAVYEAFAVTVDSGVDALLENLEGNKVWATSNEMVVVATLLNRPIWVVWPPPGWQPSARLCRVCEWLPAAPCLPTSGFYHNK